MRGMGSQRTAAVVVLIGIALAACGEQSRVDPNAVVRVSGAVQLPDGSPLADRAVKLGTGISEGEVGLALLTVGLSCTSGNCRGDRFDATTGDDGSYAFQLKGSDTQSSFGEAVSVLMSASAPPASSQVSGASISARFKVQTEDVRLPTLTLVDPGLALTGDTDVRATWSTPAAGPYTLAFETSEEIVWQTVSASPSATVDPRLLEDSSGRTVVFAERADEILGSPVTIRWRSPGTAYAGGFGPPPSRGQPCRYADGTGTVGPEVRPCGLTDGDLASTATSPSLCPATSGPATSTPATAPCPQATSVVVSTGAAVPGQLVVVRGCTGGCAVETSPDGTTFTPVGSVSDDFGALALDGRPVVAVRVGLGAQETLREVSVWGPRPAKPALRPIGADGREKLEDGFGGGAPDTDGGVPTWLVAAAAALAAAALAGVAYVLGRRRRPA